MVSIKKMIANVRAWKNIATTPNAEAWMKVVQDVMTFCNEVNEKKRPMLTQLRAINYGESDVLPKEMDMVSLWAGVGTQNPIDRLKHLRAQIEGLREVINEIKLQIQDTPENEVLLMNIHLILKSTD